MDDGIDHAFTQLRRIVGDGKKPRGAVRKVRDEGQDRMYFSKVSASGRVTLPKRLREEMEVGEDFVVIEQLGEAILVSRIKTLNDWCHAHFGKEAMEKGVTWEAAEKALEKAGPEIMRELYGDRSDEAGLVDRGRIPSKKTMRKEIVRCPCGFWTEPRMFRIRGFDIRGSECPKCGEGYFNGEDANRSLIFNKLQHWVLKRIDPDYGLELRARTKRELARSRAEVKAGRTYTMEEVKKKLRL